MTCSESCLQRCGHRNHPSRPEGLTSVIIQVSYTGIQGIHRDTTPNGSSNGKKIIGNDMDNNIVGSGF